METDPRPLDLRKLLLGTLGVSLLIAGLGVAIWGISVIGQALYEPTEIPLIKMITDPGTGDMAFHVTNADDTFSVYGSRTLALILLAGVLLAALGGIISALISGGVNLLGDATWRTSSRATIDPKNSKSGAAR